MKKTDDHRRGHTVDRNENSNPRDRHQLAVAILAIATAVIGFGLFGADFQTAGDSPWSPRDGINSESLLVLAFFALVSYALVVVSAGRILLREHNPSGVDLVKGPLFWMAVEIIPLALIFVIRLFQVPASN